MSLPRRLTQDEAALAAIAHLMNEFDVDNTVVAYIDHMNILSEKHNHPVWPSHWTAATAKYILEDFEAWCFESAWLASL